MYITMVDSGVDQIPGYMWVLQYITQFRSDTRLYVGASVHYTVQIRHQAICGCFSTLHSLDQIPGYMWVLHYITQFRSDTRLYVGASVHYITQFKSDTRLYVGYSVHYTV
jgi:outer membrane protein W